MAATRKLQAPPIAEAILDVRWGLNERPADLHDEYSLLLGRLFDRAKATYARREAQTQLPRELFSSAGPGVRMFFDRLRGESEYPLVQLGPGVASLHVDGPNYDWRGTVRPDFLQLLGWLGELVEDFGGRVGTIAVRSVDFFATPDPSEFLRGRLAIDIRSGANELPIVAGATESPVYLSTWALNDKMTDLRVQAGPGLSGTEGGVVLDILVSTRGERYSAETAEGVVDHLHRVAGDVFFAILSPEERDART